VLSCSTHNLAGIKDTIRIERLFYGAHHLDTSAGFRGKVNFLALADSVFACACSFIGERTLHDALRKGLGAPDLVRITQIDKRQSVEIAVAHMAHNGCGKAQFLDIGLCFLHASGEI